MSLVFSSKVRRKVTKYLRRVAKQVEDGQVSNPCRLGIALCDLRIVASKDEFGIDDEMVEQYEHGEEWRRDDLLSQPESGLTPRPWTEQANGEAAALSAG